MNSILLKYRSQWVTAFPGSVTTLLGNEDRLFSPLPLLSKNNSHSHQFDANNNQAPVSFVLQQKLTQKLSMSQKNDTEASEHHSSLLWWIAGLLKWDNSVEATLTWKQLWTESREATISSYAGELIQYPIICNEKPYLWWKCTERTWRKYEATRDIYVF